MLVDLCFSELPQLVPSSVHAPVGYGKCNFIFNRPSLIIGDQTFTAIASVFAAQTVDTSTGIFSTEKCDFISPVQGFNSWWISLTSSRSATFPSFFVISKPRLPNCRRCGFWRNQLEADLFRSGEFN